MLAASTTSVPSVVTAETSLSFGAAASRAALFAHAQTRVLQLLGLGLSSNHARVGVEEHALVVGGAFAQPRHAHERRDFEAVRQNRRVTRHAPFFEHETDDVGSSRSRS